MEKILQSVESIRKITDARPKIALVLGSGLGDFVKEIEVDKEIDYKDIKGFKQTAVAGHKGKLIFGKIADIPIVVMQGRYHYYEGYSMQDVVMPIRVAKMLGAEILMLTNAAGGINKRLKAGSLMLISGHISSFVPSPLIGKNYDQLGTRFPDMSNVYDKNLQDLIINSAKSKGIKLNKGVYLQTSGPNYETKEEVTMYGRLGADAVGMSTACESIAAHHAGMRVCAISCISNLATGISKNPLSHKDVAEVASRIAPKFNMLIKQSIINFFQ